MQSNDEQPVQEDAGSRATEPVGQGSCTVEQGDCLSSIAYKHGFFWETLWDLPENAELKRVRKNPFVLREGDMITIPERRLKEESRDTEMCHCFRRKGVPERLSLVLLDREGKPRGGLRYKLDIDGDVRQGNTDSEGKIEELIPPGAQRGELVIGQGKQPENFNLHLGNLDPATDCSGVQMRLQNLGYDCGPMDGEETSEFVEALQQFQSDHNLPVTGEPDDATRQKLEELHGC